MIINQAKDESIIKAYEHAEKTRLNLYNAITEDIKRGYLTIENAPIISDWKAEIYDTDKIKIYIPDYPPRINKISSLFRDIWIRNIANCIRNLENCPQYSKAFVWVKFFLPRKDWDIDNRDIKPIVDGIRYSRIINDDTYDNICYGFEGYFNELPHTEIYIINYDDFKINDLLKA